MRDTEKRGESVSEHGHAGKSSIAANENRGAQPVPSWSRPLPSRTSSLTSSPGTSPGALASSLNTLNHLVTARRSISQDVHCLLVANIS